MKRHLLILLLFVFRGAFAATVDTVETYSNSMHKNIKAVVIKPEGYDRLAAMPTVYLLHGYGGNYAAFIQNIPELKDYADLYQIILVCSDGNISSWYLDSPVNPASRYETYTATELVNWIDTHYKTIKNRNGRAITGYSMGGHGALYLSFRHQDIFGAAGSMSGGVDIRPFPANWAMAAQLGTYPEHPENWEKNTVINMVHLLSGNHLALTIDCGTEDFFYKVNVNFHELLLLRNIPHEFISRPGAHNFAYWSNSIRYQLLFFHNHFITASK